MLGRLLVPLYPPGQTSSVLHIDGYVQVPTGVTMKKSMFWFFVYTRNVLIFDRCVRHMLVNCVFQSDPT